MAAAVVGIEEHVRANPSRSAVAGFDLTFTVPKSASVLHQASQLTGSQVLEGIVATDGAEHSATATLRERQDHATSPHRLTPIRDTLRAGQEIETSEEVDRLISIRASLRRAAAAAPRHPWPAASTAFPQRPERSGPEPMGR